MSAATELPPVVYIPERARPREEQRTLHSVPPSGQRRLPPQLLVRPRLGGAPIRPSAMQPSSMQPRAMQPSSMQPSAMQPSSMQPRPIRVLVGPRASSDASLLGRGAGRLTQGAAVEFDDSKSVVSVPAVESAPAVAFRRSADVRAGLGVCLTTRGRLVLAIVSTALALGFLWLAHASAIASTNGSTASTSSVGDSRLATSPIVIVHDGDTLWTIATQVDPSRDPRDMVAKLRKLNSLTDVTLFPGQTIRTR